jgi:hypothetical protein
MAALSKRDIEMIFRAETDSAQRPVNELGAEVKRLRQSLEDLAKTGGKTDKSLDNLVATTHELEQAQSELANARTLLTQLNAQANALDRAEEKAAQAAKTYEQLKTQVDGAEKPTKRLTTSMEAAERRMNATNQRLEEQRKNYTEVKTSIESIIGPVDNLQTAFRTVAVAQRDITQGLAAAKGSVASFKAEIADTKVEADRLSQVDAFRKLAADSIAADNAADRIRAGLDGSATSAKRLTDAVQNIVNPARAAADTLDGMDARLKSVTDKMAGGKISVNEWNHLNNELEGVQASLVRVSAEVDTFTKQQSRVDDAASAYDRQAAKVRELATAQVNASTNVEELTADLQREEAQLNRLGGALDRETAKLREFGGALQRVGVNTSNLPAAIQRIEQTATRAAPAIQKVRNVITPGGKGGFLGLDPFQLQNLSYQVNDVFTSLGSGAPPLQVLAQQGGQILQIFPGILSTFTRFLHVIAPLAAGLFVLGSAVSEANTKIQTLRTANTVLASLGELNGYDPKKFQQIVADFRTLGVSAEEATEAAKTFVKEGLNPKAVDDYIIAAKNLADVHNTEVTESVEEITKAFTAGADEVIKLDDKYGFLTETQRENLIASKDTKNEYNEVNKAFSALYRKMQDGANAAKGPMTKATDTLRVAWRSLLDTFADTGVVEDVTRYISNAVIGFTFLINLAKRTAGLFGKLNDALNNNDNFVTRGIAIYKVLTEGPSIGEQAEADTLGQMGRAQAAISRLQTAAGVDAGAGSRGRQRREEAQTAKDRKQAEKDRKKAASDAEAESKRRQREAEQLEKQYQNEQDQLQSALSRFTIEALRNSQAPLNEQLQMAKIAVDEQFRAVEDRLQEFRDKFGPNRQINGMSQEEFAGALQRQKQQIVLAKQLGVYESNVNDLMKSRSERLRTIQEAQSAGLIDAQRALDLTYEVTSDLAPKIDAAIVAAQAFIASLTPSAETQALLDKFSRIQQQGSPDKGDTILRRQAEGGANQNEKDINDLFEKRARLVAAANNLYEAGAINFTEREDQIRLAYEYTNKEIQEGIAAARAYIEANSQLLPPDVVSNALAQLHLFNSELKYTDELTRTVKQSAEDAISTGIMGMFDSLASGIANVITGAGSLKDLLGNLGRAALQFAANFAKSIAQAIMQLYALRIAKSLVGGFHGGGTVGDYGGGQMKLSRDIGLSALNLSAVPRYHEGTQGAGLKSNEMLAVLEKGEKVQTEEQQAAEKRKLDGARKSGQGRGLRQVLAFGDQEVAGAMSGPAGEEVVVTHIRRNRTRLRQELGIN